MHRGLGHLTAHIGDSQYNPSNEHAIIVSFLGRLHPVGVFIAGIVLAITYVGGQVAQTTVHVPSASGGIFQALMLFLILAGDVLVRYRLVFKS